MLFGTVFFIGCFILACGDSAGTTVDFMPCGSFTPVTDLVGGDIFRLISVQWADDTSQALCLATSLINNGFDPLDQLVRYLRWNEQGYMSSNGKCFDIGTPPTTPWIPLKPLATPLLVRLILRVRVTAPSCVWPRYTSITWTRLNWPLNCGKSNPEPRINLRNA